MTNESVSAVVVGIVTDDKNWTFFSSGLMGSAPERAKKVAVVEESGDGLWSAATLEKDADWFGGCGWYRRCLWWFRITKEAIRYLSDLRRSTLRHAGRTPPPSYLNALSRKEPGTFVGGRRRINTLFKNQKYYIEN